ncbi:MAG: hypothetical protein KDD38_07435 [Bdellovibrionales bacterium]|nr:hypothetical protein [Bdellovibrionales bacterium]
MCNIKHLTATFLFTVFFLGLIGCSADKIQNQSHHSPWSVGEIEFLRGDDLPIALRNALSTQDHYRFSDKIRFVSFKNNTKGVTLTSKTTCIRDSEVLPTHTFSEGLKAEYYFFEFLSKEIITTEKLEPSSPTKCTFSIELKNSSGDTHSFTMASMPIESDEVADSVLIEKSKSPLYRNQKDLFEVNSDELLLYTLPSLKSVDYTYYLECTDMYALLLNQHNPPRFDQFNFIERKNQSEESNEPSPIQTCRVFLLHKSSKVEKISDLFVLAQPSPTPVVSDANPMAAIRPIDTRDNLLVGSYILTNPTDTPMHLSIDTQQNIQFTVVRGAGRDKFTGTVIERPIYASSPGFKFEITEGTTRFTLGPQQSINLNIHAKARRFDCGRALAYGVYYRSVSTNGIYIESLLDNTRKANTQNTLSRTLLIDPTTHYIYYNHQPTGRRIGAPSPGPGFSPPPNSIPPKIDSITTGCTII